MLSKLKKLFTYNIPEQPNVVKNSTFFDMKILKRCKQYENEHSQSLLSQLISRISVDETEEFYSFNELMNTERDFSKDKVFMIV